MLHVTFSHSRQATVLQFLIIEVKLQLCSFSLADLNSGELKSDTNSLPPLYFPTERHCGSSGSGSILPHHLLLHTPPCTNTLHT